MVDITAPELPSALRAKSVQDHIDELPMWADGTHLPSAPMTGMQWLIWSLAAAGKFFEGFVVFMTGVALPLFSRRVQYRAGRTGSSAPRACSAFWSAPSGLAGFRIASAASRCSSPRW